jgi:SAM-dependent methyltransferase
LELRDSFERAAAIYDEARPRYPDALFRTLLRRTGLEAPAEILEVGCGPGVASTPLAKQGHRLTCLERGAELSARAREKLVRFPGVSVVHASFEDWAPPRWGGFDLVFAATAWHWLDPSTRYVQAHRVDRFDWETTYDATGYLALLDTFSGHIAMEPSKRARLYSEIRRRLAQRPDGRLRRHWEAVLHVAQRLPTAS